MAEEKKHSKIGASGAHRWLHCPGSVRLIESLPEEDKKRSSKYADEGTIAHAVVEKGLKTGSWNALLSMTSDARRANISPMVIQEYLDVIKGDMDEGSEIQAELDINLKAFVPGMFGTVDTVMWSKKTTRLRVYDFKYGAGVSVSAEWNPQVMFYALGALLSRPLHSYDDVEIVIVQPRMKGYDGPDRWLISVDELMEWGEKTLKPAALKALEANAPLKAGSWCNFCKAQVKCPEAVNKSIEMAKDEFDVYKADPKSEYTPAKIGCSSDEDIARLLLFHTALDSWAKKAKEYLLEKMERGEVVPGWKLVRKQVKRQWVDEEEVKKVLYPEYGDVIFELLTPYAMEQAIHSKKKVEVLWEKIEAGLTIAPESSKRPAVIPEVQRAEQALIDFASGAETKQPDVLDDLDFRDFLGI